MVIQTFPIKPALQIDDLNLPPWEWQSRQVRASWPCHSNNCGCRLALCSTSVPSCKSWRHWMQQPSVNPELGAPWICMFPEPLASEFLYSCSSVVSIHDFGLIGIWWSLSGERPSAEFSFRPESLPLESLPLEFPPLKPCLQNSQPSEFQSSSGHAKVTESDTP